MKIYTKSGDKGKTSLVGGKRVNKDSIKVESYGTVDELNSVIGTVRAFNKEYNNEFSKKLEDNLKKIQNNLLNIGSLLATPLENINPNTININENNINMLEEIIDTMNDELEPLKTFIIPGGGKVSSLLHLSRTVCRRAERVIVSLNEVEEVNQIILKYINRLSDVLFIMARWVSQKQGEPEFLWEK